MLPSDAVYQLAADTLAAVVNRWPDDASPLPERQFVSNGFVTWDCEEVAVAVERTYGVEGEPGFETASASGVHLMGVRAIQVAIWIIRCVPDMTTDDDENVIVPSAVAIDASAAELLTDPTAIINALITQMRTAEGLGSCSGIAFQNWTAEGPSGGLGGGTLRVAMTLV